VVLEGDCWLQPYLPAPEALVEEVFTVAGAGNYVIHMANAVFQYIPESLNKMSILKVPDHCIRS